MWLLCWHTHAWEPIMLMGRDWRLDLLHSRSRPKHRLLLVCLQSTHAHMRDSTGQELER